MPKLSGNASKSSLREALHRLKTIRQRCGKEDEEDKNEGSGDPFRDLATATARDIQALKENIAERNEAMRKHGSDQETIEASHDINRLFIEVREDMAKLKNMVDETERRLIKGRRKKKAEKKLVMLERQWNDRRMVYESVEDALRAAEEANNERFDKRGGKKMQEIDTKKMMLRQQLMDTTAAGGAGETMLGGGAPGSSTAEDFTGLGPGGGRLEDQKEYQAQLSKIKEQEKKMDAALDRVHKGVGRLKETAIQMGTELSVQNQMLENTEKKMDDQTKSLKNLNRRLKKLTRESKPLNTFINIGCFLLLLALTGYFLLQFNVI